MAAKKKAGGVKRTKLGADEAERPKAPARQAVDKTSTPSEHHEDYGAFAPLDGERHREWQARVADGVQRALEAVAVATKALANLPNVTLERRLAYTRAAEIIADDSPADCLHAMVAHAICYAGRDSDASEHAGEALSAVTRSIMGIASAGERALADRIEHVSRGAQLKSVDDVSVSIRELSKAIGTIHSLFRVYHNRADPDADKANTLAGWLNRWPQTRRKSPVSLDEAARILAAPSENGRVARAAIAVGIIRADASDEGEYRKACNRVRLALEAR